jgi:hypothetical protein
MLIDDFSDQDLISKIGTRWRGVSDKVMGGVSQASVSQIALDERTFLLLTGEVCLENNGGFIQASLDLAKSGDTLDASTFAGVRLVVRGNGEQYSVHLRTPDNIHPWQSYRAHFIAAMDWKTVDLPFPSFSPHRLETHLDVSRLRRLGLAAIGRPFSANLAISKISFFN